MDTVVLTTRTRWSELPRLRHDVARQLARWYRVIFVETPMSWRGRGDTTLEEVEPRILRCRLTGRANLPARLRRRFLRLSDWWEEAERRELCNTLDRIGVRAPDAVLVNFNHHATALMEWGGFGASVYICNDDWIAKAKGRLARRVARRTEARVAGGADFCLAVSHPLVARLRTVAPRTGLFLPAHDFRTTPPAEERFWSLGRSIRALFVGNLDRRVEVDWLLNAAGQPDLEVHAIGTVRVGEREVELHRGGVHFHEPRFGVALQDFMETMDVFVIPYMLHEDVRAVTASNKLFKYFAAARPVVISDMPHFLDAGRGMIYRARTAMEFVDRLRQAVREDSTALRERRREIARGNTWNQRGEWLRQRLEEARAGRPPRLDGPAH